MLLRFVAAIAIVAVITWIYFKAIHVNPTTVGFSFLIAVLLVSTAWGLRYAILMSLVAAAAYNYFFLPPMLTFTIADPQNWVALFAFLFTAVVGSQLSERVRGEAHKSNQRRREVERLYSFSQQLLVTSNVFGLLNNVPMFIVESFGAAGAAIYLENKQKTYFSDATIQPLIAVEELRAVSGRGEPVLDRKRHVCFMPLRMGVRTLGSLGVIGCDLSRETLEAISSLIGIAIERAGTMEKLTKSEAARESDRLRSLLLDSVTHEFRTPLTSIKASAETLLSSPDGVKPEFRELVTVIDEESDRLNRLVGEAAEVAQLDAHQVELQFASHSIQEAIGAAVEQCRHALDRHPVELNSPPDLPKVRMDVKRVTEVLCQLLENAGKYSPPGTPVHITAEKKDKELLVSVADHGPGIDDMEQSMIFEKFYRGRNQRLAIQGTGMGLAIAKAIVELHGGAIGVTSQLGHGTVFHFSLPLPA
jgi:two-component system sensor histidine kinase KdpD